jgi:cytoskeletal protein CcmA (bactofilin family)
MSSTEHTKQMSSTEHTMPDANRLYIGEGVTIKGEISVPDTLVVCGVLEGDVTVGNLIVGETGAIKGRITVAENAEISGKVYEKLDVKCLLILRSTGRVDGNISYGLLQIEQGASIAGGLSSTDYRPDQKPPKVELYPREQKSQKLDSSRGSKQGGLSPLEPLPTPATPPGQ